MIHLGSTLTLCTYCTHHLPTVLSPSTPRVLWAGRQACLEAKQGRPTCGMIHPLSSTSHILKGAPGTGGVSHGAVGHQARGMPAGGYPSRPGGCPNLVTIDIRRRELR